MKIAAFTERDGNPETLKAIVAREMELPSIIDCSWLETTRIKPNQIGVRLAEAKAVGYAN